MTLVSVDAAPAAGAAAEPVWHGRHRARHGLRLRGLHLTVATARLERGGHLVHFAGARFRRVLAHLRHPVRLRLTSAAGVAADQEG